MASVIGRVNTLNIDLKTNTCLPTFYDEIDVLGYFDENDGGGGKFYWDPASVEANNDATIVAITGVATGRWKRVMNGNCLKVEWFGAIGVDSGTPSDNTTKIQDCFDYFSTDNEPFDLPINNGVIDFPGNKIFGISNSLKLRGHQTINFNNSKIKFIATDGIGKSCFERKNRIDNQNDNEDNYIISKVVLNDLLLDGGKAQIGVDFYGISFSTIKNARIYMTDGSVVGSIGVNLIHGGKGNKHCYFNLIENAHITMQSNNDSKGIFIDGKANISGANHNRIVGGEITGNDSVGIHIGNTNNNVGNFISNVDFESNLGSVNDSIAIKCESASNYFENNHIETYKVLYDFSQGGNIVLGGTKAGAGVIKDTANNVYLGLDKDSNGMIQVIGRAKNDYNLEPAGGTRQVLVSDYNCNQIFENVSSNVNSRNYGMLSVWDGNEFEFRISKVKGGNPVVTNPDPEIGGKAIWRANQHRHFEVENNLKINGIPMYANNQAAYDDGWLGYLWQTPTGEVRVCKMP